MIRTSGTPLDAENRELFGSHFGRDFGKVRVHTDDRAVESARAVAARAYTVGSHIVLGERHVSWHTPSARRLLAHELTHVVQQDGLGPQPALSELTIDDPASEREREAHAVAAMFASEVREDPSVSIRALPAHGPPELQRWEACQSTRACPEREPGESSKAHVGPLRVRAVSSTPSDLAVFGFDIGSSNAGPLERDLQWIDFVKFVEAEKHRWEILGFSDCEGRPELNSRLRLARAQHVASLLSTGARKKIDRVSAADLSDCVSENDSEEGRTENRSVVFHRTVTEFSFAPEPVTGVPCPPQNTNPVSTIADYVALLMCAESKLGLSPREMLAVFRQLYYGKPWSFSNRTDKWERVIPCSPNLGDPSGRLGKTLFEKLGRSNEVAGVDVGHVFTGLEAMVCPSPGVSFVKGLWIVEMSNEAFATWGGDLGAAVAALVACPILGSDAAGKSDCGNVAGSQSFSFYLQVHAPAQDLEGDIDAFVIRANQLGIPCATSPRTAFSPTRPVSEIFADYYLDPTSALGTSHANSAACLLDLLGVLIQNQRITNMAAVQQTISNQVASFADLYFVKIRGGSVTDLSDAGDRARMRNAASKAAEFFLTFLAGRL